MADEKSSGKPETPAKDDASAAKAEEPAKETKPPKRPEDSAAHPFWNEIKDWVRHEIRLSHDMGHLYQPDQDTTQPPAD